MTPLDAALVLLRTLLDERTTLNDNMKATHVRSTAILEENRALKRRVAALEEALVWCSGSSDFSPEGKAFVGFQKGVAPLLRTIGQLDAPPAV